MWIFDIILHVHSDKWQDMFSMYPHAHLLLSLEVSKLLHEGVF